MERVGHVDLAAVTPDRVQRWKVAFFKGQGVAVALPLSFVRYPIARRTKIKERKTHSESMGSRMLAELTDLFPTVFQ